MNNVRRLSTRQLVLLVIVLAIAVATQYIATHQPGAATPQPEAPATEPAGLPSEPAAVVATTAAPVITRTPAAATPTARASATPARATATTGSTQADQMARFDYFVLSLSWSPDYCATSGGDDPQQCSLGKKLGFVLHGLWPQNNQGYPSNCSTVKMPQSVKDQFPGLYPNDDLFDHEWEKHGTCTGLTPARFLALSKQIKESVAIPAAYKAPETAFHTTTDQLKQAFAQANPNFPSAAFETNCSGSGRYLKEVYVCFARDGSPMACGTEVHKDALKSCQSADFIVRNTR